MTKAKRIKLCRNVYAEPGYFNSDKGFFLWTQAGDDIGMIYRRSRKGIYKFEGENDVRLQSYQLRAIADFLDKVVSGEVVPDLPDYKDRKLSENKSMLR